jgi:hypothetical protein
MVTQFHRDPGQLYYYNVITTLETLSLLAAYRRNLVRTFASHISTATLQACLHMHVYASDQKQPFKGYLFKNNKKCWQLYDFEAPSGVVVIIFHFVLSSVLFDKVAVNFYCLFKFL